MNASEHIVEIYFRFIRKYFTMSDVKVVRGNNRQFDILAIDPKKKKTFHIEVAVTHQLNWNYKLIDSQYDIEYKFFGKPREKETRRGKTDYAKGRNYLKEIKETYKEYGMDYNKVIRIWCVWVIKDSKEELELLKKRLARNWNIGLEHIEFLSLREDILPPLLSNVGSSNYDDEILRTLSLLNEYGQQKQNRRSLSETIFKLSDEAASNF